MILDKIDQNINQYNKEQNDKWVQIGRKYKQFKMEENLKMVKEIIQNQEYNEGIRYYFIRLMKEKRISQEIVQNILFYMELQQDIVLLLNLLNNEKSKRWITNDIIQNIINKYLQSQQPQLIILNQLCSQNIQLKQFLYSNIYQLIQIKFMQIDHLLQYLDQQLIKKILNNINDNQQINDQIQLYTKLIQLNMIENQLVQNFYDKILENTIYYYQEYCKDIIQIKYSSQYKIDICSTYQYIIDFISELKQNINYNQNLQNIEIKHSQQLIINLTLLSIEIQLNNGQINQQKIQQLIQITQLSINQQNLYILLIIYLLLQKLSETNVQFCQKILPILIQNIESIFQINTNQLGLQTIHIISNCCQQLSMKDLYQNVQIIEIAIQYFTFANIDCLNIIKELMWVPVDKYNQQINTFIKNNLIQVQNNEIVYFQIISSLTSTRQIIIKDQLLQIICKIIFQSEVQNIELKTVQNQIITNLLKYKILQERQIDNNWIQNQITYLQQSQEENVNIQQIEYIISIINLLIQFYVINKQQITNEQFDILLNYYPIQTEDLISSGKLLCQLYQNITNEEQQYLILQKISSITSPLYEGEQFDSFEFNDFENIGASAQILQYFIKTNKEYINQFDDINQFIQIITQLIIQANNIMDQQMQSEEWNNQQQKQEIIDNYEGICDDLSQTVQYLIRYQQSSLQLLILVNDFVKAFCSVGFNNQKQYNIILLLNIICISIEILDCDNRNVKNIVLENIQFKREVENTIEIILQQLIQYIQNNNEKVYARHIQYRCIQIIFYVHKLFNRQIQQQLLNRMQQLLDQCNDKFDPYFLFAYDNKISYLIMQTKNYQLIENMQIDCDEILSILYTLKYNVQQRQLIKNQFYGVFQYKFNEESNDYKEIKEYLQD